MPSLRRRKTNPEPPVDLDMMGPGFEDTRRKSRKIILAGVIMAIAAGGASFVLLSRAQSQAANNQVPHVAVVVAARASSLGTLVSLSAARACGSAAASARCDRSVHCRRSARRGCTTGCPGGGMESLGAIRATNTARWASVRIHTASAVRSDSICDANKLWVAADTSTVSSVANGLRTTAPMAQDGYLGTHMVWARPAPSNKRTTTVVLRVCLKRGCEGHLPLTKFFSAAQLRKSRS